MISYRNAFAAVRKDPRWKRKIGLGILVSLIPYVGTVWMLGWEMQYQRAVAWGRDEELPEWSDFSGQALLGLKGMVAVLPYSFILVLAVVPGAVAIPLWLAPQPEATVATTAVLMGVGFGVLLVALMLLMIPLTGAVMLRVSLFGTIESGFQLKEILRLMRQHKAELLRAWGFAALNTAIPFAVNTALLAVFVLAFALVVRSWEQALPVVVALSFLAYFAGIALNLAVSLYMGLVNMQFFGRYGRIAYRLVEQPVGERG